MVPEAEVSGHAADWAPEQIRLAQIYGICALCRAPRTSVTEQRPDGSYYAWMECLNGHPAGIC
jgi:hypothetical protein